MKVVMALLAACVLASAASAQEVKIGYVDLQRALNESESGKKAKDEFKVQVERVRGDLKKQKDEIDKLKEQIEKKSLVIKEEERRNLEKDYQRRLRDFERSYKDTEGDLQNKDNELTGSILRELQEVIHEYGDREKYSLILEASNSVVLFGSKNADLTEKIIELYNQAKSKKKKD